MPEIIVSRLSWNANCNLSRGINAFSFEQSKRPYMLIKIDGCLCMVRVYMIMILYDMISKYL